MSSLDRMRRVSSPRVLSFDSGSIALTHTNLSLYSAIKSRIESPDLGGSFVFIVLLSVRIER